MTNHSIYKSKQFWVMLRYVRVKCEHIFMITCELFGNKILNTFVVNRLFGLFNHLNTANVNKNFGFQ